MTGLHDSSQAGPGVGLHRHQIRPLSLDCAEDRRGGVRQCYERLHRGAARQRIGDRVEVRPGFPFRDIDEPRLSIYAEVPEPGPSAGIHPTARGRTSRARMP